MAKISCKYVKTASHVLMGSFCKRKVFSKKTFLKNILGLRLETIFIFEHDFCSMWSHSTHPEVCFEEKSSFQKQVTVCVFHWFLGRKRRIFDWKITTRFWKIVSTCTNNLFGEQKNILRRIHFFNNISGLRAEKNLIFDKTFSEFFWKLYFAFPMDQSDIFLNNLRFLKISRSGQELSRIFVQKFSQFYLKSALFVFRRKFSAKLSAWNLFLRFLSLSDFNKKIGLLTEEFRHGCPNCLLQM